MKYKANGGYQILNFEGVNITSLTSIDFNVVKSAILREKTIQVIDLVVGTEKVNGVADASYDATNNKCVLTIALKVIEIASDSTLTISDVKTGTEVEANVQLVGDESHLSSIQIDDTKYKVSQVEPSTSQTYDEEIDKIKIDGTIYKVGGGQPLYRHTIGFPLTDTYYGSNKKVIFDLIIPEATPVSSVSDIVNYITKYYTYPNISGAVMPRMIRLSNVITNLYTDSQSNKKLFVVENIGVQYNGTKLAFGYWYIGFDANGVYDSYFNTTDNIQEVNNNQIGDISTRVVELKPIS